MFNNHNPDHDEDLMPELKDLINRIHAFNVSHKEGCFVYNFVGFKPDTDTECEQCGGDCDEVDDNKSHMGAYGNLDTLRILTNMLRDLVEDNIDDDGFVNI